MKINKLALLLAMVAGLLCLGSFMYNWLKLDRMDYTILFAGIFIIAFGFATSTNKKE